MKTLYKPYTNSEDLLFRMFDFNTRNEEQALRHVLRIACHVAPFHVASYWHVHEEAAVRAADLKHIEGTPPEDVMEALKSNHNALATDETGIISWVLREELPLYVDDYQNHPLVSASFAGTMLYECCAIPIHIHRPSGKQLVGILFAMNVTERVGAISPSSIALLESAVYQLQISLEHYDGMRQLESHVSLYSILYDAINDISEAKTITDAHQALMHSLQTSFQVNMASLRFEDQGIVSQFGWNESLQDPETAEERFHKWTKLLSHEENIKSFSVTAGTGTPAEVMSILKSLDMEYGLVTALRTGGQIMGHLTCYWPQAMTPHISQAIYQLCTVFAGVYTSLIETQRALDAKVQSLATLGIALESRDGETFGHTQRVVAHMESFMQKLGLWEDYQDGISGAYLHDIGKIAIPDAILLKPGRLDDEERKIMQTHTIQGYAIAQRLHFIVQSTLDVILSHHERWDGAGYPGGLAGTEIPLLARLFSIIDVYDALTHERPYKSAWSQEEALDYLQQNAGTQFDPELTVAFVELIQAEQSP